MSHYSVLVAGAGTAGLTVAAKLAQQPDAPSIAIIDPAKKHYYQPLWTLIGAGVFPREESEREMADYMPNGIEWIQSAVSQFEPEQNQVLLADGQTVTYDILVVALGIQVDWDKIPGLQEGLHDPDSGVCSNYSYDTVEKTWRTIQKVKNGNALFTHPSTPIKCGGAPLKITFLASDYWMRQGIKSHVHVNFIKGGGGIFAVPKYAKTLTRVAERYHIECTWNTDLISIDPRDKVARFRNNQTGAEHDKPFSMLHVTPPMSAPEVIKASPLAADTGWVSVDKETTQHTKYPNVFALGDCSNLPTSKTGAAIRKQAPVTADNVMAYLQKRELTSRYEGYTSCPLVTGYGRLVLAEFDYNKEPMESFPFDQSKERYSMYALKAYGLPRIYWHGMLRGRDF